MIRIGSSWVVAAGLLFSLGCADGTFVLGHLSEDATGPDASTSDAFIGNGDASGGTGGSAGAGGTGGSGGNACTVTSKPAVRRGLNVHFVVDSSFGIALQPVWGQITQALSSFVDDPSNAGIGVGIRYFGTSCNEADYAVPDVPVTLLPTGAAAIKQSTVGRLPLDGLGAAIAPAVTGGLLYASGVQRDDSDRLTRVVLITDGIFDITCGADVAKAKLAAGVAYDSVPSVSTYVIGIDGVLLAAVPSDLTPLDEIAAEGGTAAAWRVVADTTSEAQIEAAMREIRLDADPCSYRLPDGYTFENSALEWRAAGGNSMPAFWGRVANEAACTTSTSMYLSPSSDRYVDLCPNACRLVRANPAGTVKFVTVCP